MNTSDPARPRPLHRRRCAAPHVIRGAWFLPLAALCLATSAASAQKLKYAPPAAAAVYNPSGGPAGPSGQVYVDHHSKTRDFPDPWNNPHFGGSASGSAEITHSYFGPAMPASFVADSSNYDSKAEFDAHVKLFGSNYSAAHFLSTAENAPFVLSSSGATPKSNYRPKTTVSLDLAGSNVWSDSADLVARSTSLSKTWSWNLGTYNTPTVSYWFPLGPLSFKIDAYAGVSANVSLTVKANLGSVALELSGTASGSAYGVASFSLNYVVLSAGIQARLDFVNPKITPTLTANLSGLTATLEVCVTPVIFRLYLFATIGVWPLKKTFSQEILKLATPESCETFTL